MCAFWFLPITTVFFFTTNSQSQSQSQKVWPLHFMNGWLCCAYGDNLVIYASFPMHASCGMSKYNDIDWKCHFRNPENNNDMRERKIYLVHWMHPLDISWLCRFIPHKLWDILSNMWDSLRIKLLRVTFILFSL